MVREDSNICPRCGKEALIVDTTTGEVFCSECGFVVEEKSGEAGIEWSPITERIEANKSRTGAPLSPAKFDYGLSTVMGYKDTLGRSPTQISALVDRIRVWDKRSLVQGSTGQTLRKVLLNMYRVGDKLAVSEHVIERAAYIYRKAMAKGLMKGRPTMPFIAASLYAACRDMGAFRSLKEVSKASGVDKKELAKSYRLILKEMELKVPLIDPIKCIPVIASRVGLSEKTRRRALELLRKAAEKPGFAGKIPMGLAAAALYMAALMEGEHVVQKDLAKAAGITSVTVRNRYKTLKSLLES